MLEILCRYEFHYQLITFGKVLFIHYDVQNAHSFLDSLICDTSQSQHSYIMDCMASSSIETTLVNWQRMISEML